MNRAFTPLIVILILFFNLALFSQEESSMETPSYYPPFSWDKVPVYMLSSLFLETDLPLLRAELSSSHGLLIQRFSREELHEPMDLSQLSPGMYVLKVYPEHGAPLLKAFILAK